MGLSVYIEYIKIHALVVTVKNEDQIGSSENDLK